jgi:hypothetical protein
MKKQRLLKALWVGILAAGSGLGGPALAQDAAEDAPIPLEVRSALRSLARMDEHRPLQNYNDLIKGAKTYEGFITLHEKDQHLYAEIKLQQLDQPILAPMVIARGSASAGQPLNTGDEWVLSFRRVGDNLQLLRKNIHFTAPSGTPLHKAVEQNYTDSILMALPILSMSPRSGALVVDFADIFLTDFAELGLGLMDRSRSRWYKIRTYPNNVEIQVEATFSGFHYGGMWLYHYGGQSPVVDSRGITLVLHYSLCKAPDWGYRPRMADYRVGHFLNAVTDFAHPDPDTNSKRMINRWRLEKANPSAKLSPPRKQIVWYIEDNVPEEYRPYVQEGILEWNKAFEKIGFKDAIAVRWQNERDDFEPEDINYCTLRWITTGATFAQSGLRSNPLTGEIIDGDVIVDSGWIKSQKQDYAFLVGIPTPASSTTLKDQPRDVIPLAVGEVISPIMAMKQGFGLPVPPPGTSRAATLNAAILGSGPAPGALASRDGKNPVVLDVLPAGWDPIQLHLRQRLARGRIATCNYAAAKAHEMRFAALALAMAATADDANVEGQQQEETLRRLREVQAALLRDQAALIQQSEELQAEHRRLSETLRQAKDKKQSEPKLPEEFLGQAIKEVVMHEVGHSLGLRHNFKASIMLRPDQINDTSITHVKGMTGSVMDYNPINVAPKGQKQGDFASTTIGPYDYWAIEYAYAPILGNEEAELKKIATRSPDPDLAFATDEDVLNNDPQVNAYDLTSDSLAYSKMRMAMAAELLKSLDQKVVKDGESWARLRSAFLSCISQFGNGAYLASEYIGGQSVNRDFKGTGKARDPVIPITGVKQREALKLLVDQILSDKAFVFSPGLLRKLITESWEDSAFTSSGGMDYPIYHTILNIQEIVLDQCLDPGVLQRIQNQELQSDPGGDPLQLAEVFRALSQGIFTELSAPTTTTSSPRMISTIRRNLQREYIKRLSSMVLGTRSDPSLGGYRFIVFYGMNASAPPDAKNLARLHLEEIGQKIDQFRARNDLKIDDTTLAHLKEIRFRIDKVLKAGLNAIEP